MKINFTKMADLVPAIIQDVETGRVLMLGFMNKEALQKTQQSGKVTFYSRSKKRLWTKGETSGNFLLVKNIRQDCDSDTLLIKAAPTGPVCHKGQDTCFGELNIATYGFLDTLQEIISERKKNPKTDSYTTRLFTHGIKKMAQKLGEEATETAIEAVDGSKERLVEESADLLYHLLVMLQAKDLDLDRVVAALESRHKS